MENYRIFFICAVAMSFVYVFDVSTYPFIHIPFYILTLLYFASIAELFGVTKLTGFVRTRLRNRKSLNTIA